MQSKYNKLMQKVEIDANHIFVKISEHKTSENIKVINDLVPFNTGLVIRFHILLFICLPVGISLIDHDQLSEWLAWISNQYRRLFLINNHRFPTSTETAAGRNCHLRSSLLVLRIQWMSWDSNLPPQYCETSVTSVTEHICLFGCNASFNIFGLHPNSQSTLNWCFFVLNFSASD